MNIKKSLLRMESLTPDLEDFENSGGASSLSSSLISSTGFCIIIVRASVFSSVRISESRFVERENYPDQSFPAKFVSVKVNQFLWVFSVGFLLVFYWFLGSLLEDRINFPIPKIPISRNQCFESLNLSGLSYCSVVLQCS